MFSLPSSLARIVHLRKATEDAPIFLDKMEIPTVGWMAIFGDPGGNRIGVMQRMPPA